MVCMPGFDIVWSGAGQAMNSSPEMNIEGPLVKGCFMNFPGHNKNATLYFALP